jgi:hypothetical protein
MRRNECGTVNGKDRLFRGRASLRHLIRTRNDAAQAPKCLQAPAAVHQ